MDRIRPYEKNPAYWQYKGRPVLLLGGSVEDNLFQIPNLQEHLDLLKSVGGNYVRCTMSSRDDGDVWPFEANSEGLYDLEVPNPEYWRRFEAFLKLTTERDIIVQIELWATFDFYREYWRANPFNPACNVNYSPSQSRLPETVRTHPVGCDNPFFWSVPAEHDNEVVLRYQHAFVDKLLSISLGYPNVLYCMDNETSVTPEWGWYWAGYIQAAARQAGVEVHTTEMWDKWDLSHPQHDNTFDHPEIYSFVDISQNNHNQGQAHWDNAQTQLKRVRDSGVLRPVNCVKTYGADAGRHGNDRDGQERFWRNVFGGVAACRFHRPFSGLGLDDKAQANIRSMRMIADQMNVFSPTCRPANDLLVGAHRSANEAYCMADAPRVYAVYFTDGGCVFLDASAAEGKPLTVQWLDIRSSQWREQVKISINQTGIDAGSYARRPQDYRFDVTGKIQLAPPAEGMWAALVKPVP